jgi:MFS family permease
VSDGRAAETPAADGEIRHTTRRAMFAVIAAAGLVGLAFGYSLPLLAIVMENRGIGSTLIGLGAASESAAILLFGPVVPRIIGTLGLRQAMFASALIGVLALGALAFFDPLYAWFPLRFVLGGTIFLILIASDIWVTQGASPARRGRMVAIYGTAITSGMAVGPLLVPLVGTEGHFPIFIGAAILAAAVLPLLFAYGPAPAIERAGRLRPVALILAMPVLFASVLAFGIIDSSALSLLPIFGLHLGMSVQVSSLLLTVLVAGSIVLQFPIGWLADRTDRMRTLLLCALAGTVAAVVLPFSIGTDWLMWISLFALGGTMVSLYTLSLTILGDRYSGGEMAAAVSLIAMVLAVGSTLGPLISGGAVDAWNPYGLNLVIIGGYGLVLTVAAILTVRRRAAP